MDTVTAHTILPSFAHQEAVHTKDLIEAFDHYASKLNILSLDCFDTILWRKAITPKDVFFDLAQQPTFKSLGFTAIIRTHSEIYARQLKILTHGSTEVTLQDIYRTGFPYLSTEQIEQLIEEELTTEMNTCYAFPPMIELMRHAKLKGLKICIVSDTYLTQSHLKRLLKQALPPDVMQSIDHIFCSADHGRSKINGLFKNVLTHFNCPPETILHLGDNPTADLHAAREQKLHALRLIHHNDQVTDMLRLQSNAASLFNPSIRSTRALNNPFRGVLAKTAHSSHHAEQLIGYVSLGPILYSFAQFILNEIEKLKNAGKSPKILFLMRDAYLPSLACETLAKEPIGHRVRISRFAATAASFRTQQDIDRYLSEVVRTYRFKEIAHQLLLPDTIAEPLINTALTGWDSAYEFTRLIHQKNILNIIYQHSADYRARLIKHLQKETHFQPGDTLLFVDLGYSGTAQRLLEPIFRDELNIDIMGCYLLSLGVPGWASSRRGLLDPTHCDERLLRTFVAYIALLEQLCTSNECSVIDYDNQGNAIYSEATLKNAQHEKLKLIQSECLTFVKDAQLFFNTIGDIPTQQALMDATIAELGRLLFLPTKPEIQFLKNFQFDLNLGTNETFNIFDEEKGLESLRQRGLFFSFLEKQGNSMRTNYPAELRSAGIELALAFMTHHRFGLDISQKDMSFRHEPIQLIVVHHNQVSQTTLDASLTHDGYFSLCIPLGTGQFQIGIRFGQRYRWVQFQSAEKIRTDAYLSILESQFTEDAWATLIFNDMIDRGNKLYECLSENSFVMIPPTSIPSEHHYNLRLTFRSIVLR